MASWVSGAADADGTIHHYYSSSTTTVDDVYGGSGSGGIRTMLSRLSIESFDADEEFSDYNYAKDEIVLLGFSSDSDDAHQGGAAACYSLPATPPRWRYQNEVGYHHHQLIGIGGKEYASENEAQKHINSNSRRQRRKRSRLLRPERWIGRDAVAAAASWDHGKEVVAALGDGEDDDADDEEEEQIFTGMGMEIGGGWSWSNNSNINSSFSGGDGESSDQSGGGGGRLMRIITKPKGGRRSICMDLEEMKACRDLGFELEHDQRIMPTRLSLSAASTFDTATTSSGGDSPISNWRISSPGDDPRDVKARLKVWAQAVALASSSPRHTTTSTSTPTST
ncbi:hypothetical protein LguiA_020161 [Lonicera macranthoides]